MVWYYSVQLKAVAPSSAIRTTSQSNWKMLSSVAVNGITQTINGLLNQASVTGAVLNIL
jgi:hypothetical protein